MHGKIQQKQHELIVRGGYLLNQRFQPVETQQQQRIRTAEDAKTEKSETDPFYTIEIDVPSNAWMCDFVFSSGIGEGAQYDNRGGKDYHLPTNGSTEKAPLTHHQYCRLKWPRLQKLEG